jgi:phage-related protein (TIGR01555 family)
LSQHGITEQMFERHYLAYVKECRARFDAWENTLTGFGTARDKTTYGRFAPGLLLGEGELSVLYAEDDVAARIVDVVADEMLRESFEVDLGNPALNNEIADQCEALQLDAKLADAIRWGRLYGGGALILGANDGRSAASPLVPEKAKGLSYVYVLDRRFLTPFTWYSEAGHPRLGQPETYMVSTPHAWSSEPIAVVHESRLVLFGGATTDIQTRVANLGWDSSVLQRPWETMRAFSTVFKAVETLVVDGTQTVFKVSGLAEAILQDQSGQDFLRKRLELIEMSRSVMRAIAIDAGGSDDGEPGEDFTRQQVSMTDYPAVMQQFQLRLAAAARMPVTILMGQSPAGMNATGESDFRWFYDGIRSDQTRRLAPKIRRIVRVMLATKQYNESQARSIKVKFPPLWSEPPLQAAQTRKTIAETDNIRILSGELLPEEVALVRGQPGGYEQDIVLSPEAMKARQELLKSEYESMEAGQVPGAEPPADAETDPNAPPPAPSDGPPAEDEDPEGE